MTSQITTLELKGLNNEPVTVYKWERIESRDSGRETVITGFTRDQKEAEDRVNGKF